jgi:hypothetical protein
MKKTILLSGILLSTALAASAQSNTKSDAGEPISEKNAWLKIGLNLAAPIGDASKIASFAPGLDLRGQYMLTNHFGLGLATGYNHYLGKSPVSDFGAIPLALMLRYYPKSQGVFVGADAGYSFLTNIAGLNGGFTFKPQIGYHNYNWNFSGFYNHIFTKGAALDIQSIGLSASYNIRFK